MLVQFSKRLLKNPDILTSGCRKIIFQTMSSEATSSASAPSSDIPSDVPPKSNDEVIVVREGNVIIEYHKKFSTFYNPTQEVNRDISILAIQTFLNQRKEKKEDVTIFEAMAASGIRSIRYGKELTGVKQIIANDLSYKAIESIKLNTKLNNVEELVIPACEDAKIQMYAKLNKTPPFVVDLDPYGTPMPFVDGAVQCVEKDGLLCVTATDVAILCGNHPETCYAKYGSFSLKIGACHEMGLRILIHAVQTAANKYGRFVIPLLSLSIDFYLRIFFKVVKSAESAKNTVSQTSLLFNCTGCNQFSFQPLAKKIEKKHGLSTLAISPICENCDSKLHIGGPLWTGPIYDKEFVGKMLSNLSETYFYLNTAERITGMLNLVQEEVDVPLYYKIGELSSALKCNTMNIVKLLSSLMHLGYKCSMTHCQPNSIKTDAPNKVLWDIFRAWHAELEGQKPPPEGSIAQKILSKEITTKNISFEVREDANPASREKRLVRFQINPKKFWGPGVRSSIATQAPHDKMTRNQGKIKRRRLEKANTDKNGEEKDQTESTGESVEVKASEVKMDTSN